MTRCKYCGSEAIHPDTQRKNFSTGKAIAGAVVAGVVGAAAGFIGKDVHGYRCSQCGAFMEEPMDYVTERDILKAINDAETGASDFSYNYYKNIYPNIKAKISSGLSKSNALDFNPKIDINLLNKEEKSNEIVKEYVRNNVWHPDEPIFVQGYQLSTGESSDRLRMEIKNCSEKTIRSAYLDINVNDDAGDHICDLQIVYQNVNVSSKEMFPLNQTFELPTKLAYRISINLNKITFSDGTVWRAAGESKEIILPIQNAVTQDFPYEKNLQENAEIKELKADFIPIWSDTYWYCSCGTPNLNDSDVCSFCGGKINEIKNLFDLQKLAESFKEKVINQARETTEKQLSEIERLRTQKIKEKEEVYTSAVEDNDNSSASLSKRAKMLEILGDYKDAKELVLQYNDLANRAQEEEKYLEHCKEIYSSAIEIMKNSPEIAMEKFQSIAEYKDSKEQFEKIFLEIDRKKQLIKRVKKISFISAITFIVAVVAFVCINIFIIVPNNKYEEAKNDFDLGNYDDSMVLFKSLVDFKDSSDYIEVMNYYLRWEGTWEGTLLESNGESSWDETYTIDIEKIDRANDLANLKLYVGKKLYYAETDGESLNYDNGNYDCVLTYSDENTITVEMNPHSNFLSNATGTFAKTGVQ